MTCERDYRGRIRRSAQGARNSWAALLSLLFHPPARHGRGEALTYDDCVHLCSEAPSKATQPRSCGRGSLLRKRGPPGEFLSHVCLDFARYRVKLAREFLIADFNIRAPLPETRFGPA